jgi:Zn-dependent peptidase ImmA (M78 family)
VRKVVKMIAGGRSRNSLVRDFLRRTGHDDEKAVIELAQRLVKDADMKPPIDVFRLARFYGVEVREVEGMRLDGQVIPLKDGFIIEVAKEKPVKRKRFTIAHELIHIFLLKEGLVLLDTLHELESLIPLMRRRIERLCDIGASEILMPSHFFEPKLKDYGISVDALFRLRREFQTSITSTAIRIVRASNSCAFVFWKFMSKPGDVEDFRVSWSIAPKGIFIPRYDRAFSHHMNLHTVYEALTSSRGRSCGIEEINWLGNLKGRYYVESVVMRNHDSNIPGVLSLIHLNRQNRWRDD